MSEMVERVAGLICDREDDTSAVALARTIIMAMREPTEAMIAAFDANDYQHPVNIWTTMIDVNEMVERIAGAINLSSDRSSVGLARVAIEAMRDPTKKMICAVLDAYDANPRLTIAEDWRIMIDAALKD